jgi:hypothetical protein
MALMLGVPIDLGGYSSVIYNLYADKYRCATSIILSVADRLTKIGWQFYH